jgi:hypothetical protein
MRCGHKIATVTAQVAPSKIVGEDKNDVGLMHSAGSRILGHHLDAGKKAESNDQLILH